MSSLLTVVEVEPAPTSTLVQPVETGSEKSRRVLLALAGVWLTVASLFVWQYTLDDSYIVFRYARNLAQGIGVVFNPGQRVEGYTSFLWVCALAGESKLGLNLILASKVLGLLLNLLTLWACYFLCRLVTRRRTPMYGFSLVLTASSTRFILTSVVGLETPLFTALLCWALVAYLKAIHADDARVRPGWLVGASFLFGLLVITRPDGALVYGFLWLHAAWRFRKLPRTLAFFTLPFLLVYAPYFFWRWHYYALLLPNTFYVKRGGTLALFAKGAKETGKFLGFEVGGWFLAGATALGAFLFPAVETTVLGLAILSRVAFELWSGGVTPGEFRFLVSALPLIWILAERVLVEGLAPDATGLPRRLLLGGTTTFLIGAQAAAFIHFRQHNILPVRVGMERAHIALGKWLHAHSEGNATVAVGDIGAIGYWSQRNVLDLDGLTDTYISHLPGTYGEKRDSQYVLRTAPEFIALRSSSCNANLKSISFAMDRALFSDLVFQNRYGLVNCWEFWPSYDLLLYRKYPQAEASQKEETGPRGVR